MRSEALRILFLTTIYPAPGDSYMIGDLAQDLADSGHHVDVLHIVWKDDSEKPSALRYDGRVCVLDVYPRGLAHLGRLVYRMSKFLITSRQAAKVLTEQLDLSVYDAVVAWTPALTVASPFRLARRAKIPARLLFIFDFFPIHHREIGMIPRGPVYALAKRMEESLMRNCTTLICNLPSNIDYLRSRYRLQIDQDIVSTPLWSAMDTPPSSSPNALRERLGLPNEAPLALFGGQLVEGRGIEQMLEAASCAETAGSPLSFVFMGGGRLAAEVAREASQRSNVFYVPPASRDEYLDVIGSCDVGLVATVPGVSSYSFPTKTIDYLRVNLPVVAAVEEGSDYLEILYKYRLGVGVKFGDSESFFRAAERLATAKDDTLPLRARQCLDEVFHVRHASKTVIDAIERAKYAKGTDQ
mgnify:CR=1 FL=1